MANLQKVLTCTTECSSLRSTIVGYTYEDPYFMHHAFQSKIGTDNQPSSLNEMHVGMARSGNCPFYPTVLHALADGWRLLVPAKEFTWKNPDEKQITEYSWWLVKD